MRIAFIHSAISLLVFFNVISKYQAGKFPKALIKSSRKWRFRLERTRRLDETVYEYVIQAPSSHSPEKKYAIWTLIPGAEKKELPFEQTVPSYALMKGGFKLLSEK